MFIKIYTYIFSFIHCNYPLNTYPEVQLLCDTFIFMSKDYKFSFVCIKGNSVYS